MVLHHQLTEETVRPEFVEDNLPDAGERTARLWHWGEVRTANHEIAAVLEDPVEKQAQKLSNAIDTFLQFGNSQAQFPEAQEEKDPDLELLMCLATERLDSPLDTTRILSRLLNAPWFPGLNREKKKAMLETALNDVFPHLLKEAPPIVFRALPPEAAISQPQHSLKNRLWNTLETETAVTRSFDEPTKVDPAS